MQNLKKIREIKVSLQFYKCMFCTYYIPHDKINLFKMFFGITSNKLPMLSDVFHAVLQEHRCHLQKSGLLKTFLKILFVIITHNIKDTVSVAILQPQKMFYTS